MNNFQLLYTRDATEDVKEAVGWYNKKQKGLGNRFRNDVLDTIEKIKRNPFFASVSYNNIRTAACRTFPYSVHYTIDELRRIIIIISIYHFSRKPKSLE